jgi:hypothetical protein
LSVKRALGLLLSWACCLGAVAQERLAERSAEQRCLQHKDGAAAVPDYPSALYHANRGGRVQVELTFDGPRSSPSARVLLHEGDKALAESVREHLRGLRVPCMPQGVAPVVLRQEYVFQRDERRVHWSRPDDARERQADRRWGCRESRSPDPIPAYPESARRAAVEGRVVSRLRFEQPDAPPRVESLTYSPRTRELARSAERWASELRVPCLGTEPLTLTFVFEYHFGERYGFKEVNLLQLMAATRDIRQQRLSFDTRTMACPFELRVHYLQPHAPNAVGEPGEPVPARRPLLEWLESTQLDMPVESMEAVWGGDFKLAVPCVNIDLKPKEK